jgi:hypothetical protein
MKVLKEGEKKSWGIKQKCTGAGNGEKDGACGAELLIEENDIFQTSHSDYGGGIDYYYTVECPCCKTWTDIDGSKLPSWVRDIANKKHRGSSDRNRNED